MTNENYDPTTSDCCGANRDDDHGICLECKEHCDGVTFEDADPIANAVGKVFAVTALLCVIAFYLGFATGGN
jgi:hypothetical protein